MIARSFVALSDGLQIQWLCSTTPGNAADQRLATTMVPEVRFFIDALREQWGLFPAGCGALIAGRTATALELDVIRSPFEFSVRLGV